MNTCAPKAVTKSLSGTAQAERMVVVIAGVNLQPTFVFFLIVVLLVLMEGVRCQQEHHNKQNNDKEEDKG